MTGVPRTAVLFDAYPHVYAGAQRVDHLLARELPSRGWRVITLVPADGPFPERLRADDLPVEVLTAPPALARYGRVTTGAARLRAVAALPRYWFRVWRRLRRLRPDLVHVIDHRGLVLAGVPARLSGAAVVWQVHALDPTRALNRWGHRLAEAVVVPTTSVVSKLPGLPPGPAVRVATNTIPEELRHAPLGPLARSGEIVVLARLHPDKGLDVLIDALAEVRRSVPSATVRVLGAPQEGFEHLEAELRERAEARGVGDALQLAGFVARPAEVVRAARCVVLPSRERTEILPLAVLEAMVLGTTVVATDVGGVSDVVRDGRTGLLVPPEDPAALAAAIVRVLEDDELADRLRVAAHELVTGPPFDEASLLTTLGSLYDEVAGG